MYFVLLAGERGVLGMQVKPLQGKHSVAEPHPSQEKHVAVLTISIVLLRAQRHVLLGVLFPGPLLGKRERDPHPTN